MVVLYFPYLIQGQTHCSALKALCLGALIRYLESDKSALTLLLEHCNHHVRNWARDYYITYLDKAIAYESMRDDEHDLGIY